MVDRCDEKLFPAPPGTQIVLVDAPPSLLAFCATLPQYECKPVFANKPTRFNTLRAYARATFVLLWKKIAR